MQLSAVIGIDATSPVFSVNLAESSGQGPIIVRADSVPAPDDLYVLWAAGLADQFAVGNAVGIDVALLSLEHCFEMRNKETVHRFLQLHPTLAGVLREAIPHIRAHFGLDAQVVLEVVTDPEADGVEQLFANIRTSVRFDEALFRLDQLDQAWFLDQLDRVGGLFNLDVEPA